MLRVVQLTQIHSSEVYNKLTMGCVGEHIDRHSTHGHQRGTTVHFWSGTAEVNKIFHCCFWVTGKEYQLTKLLSATELNQGSLICKEMVQLLVWHKLELMKHTIMILQLTRAVGPWQNCRKYKAKHIHQNAVQLMYLFLYSILLYIWNCTHKHYEQWLVFNIKG
jgi:hypothetical protein